MFSLRSGAVTLALSAFALCCAHDSGASRAAQMGANPVVVGLAEGVMASFGATPPRAQAAAPTIAIHPQSGATIYVPTGEVIDEVIPVTANRDPRDASMARKTAANHAQQPNRSDAGVDVCRLDAGPSAT